MKKINLALGCCFLLGSLVFAACGGVSAQQACTDVAKAQCALLDSCRTNGTILVYGNLGTCITQLMGECMTALAAPGTGSNPGIRESCAQALMPQPNMFGESCQDYLQNNPISQCQGTTGNQPD